VGVPEGVPVGSVEGVRDGESTVGDPEGVPVGSTLGETDGDSTVGLHVGSSVVGFLEG